MMGNTEKNKTKSTVFFVGSGEEWAAALVDKPISFEEHVHDVQVECLKCKSGKGVQHG